MTKPRLAQKSRPASEAKTMAKARPQLPKTPTGIHGLDKITGGGLLKGRPALVSSGAGYYHGSNIRVSGTVGTGKSRLVAHFTDAVCRHGERVLYFSFEESPDQIIRNMRSIGINLQPWIKKGLLQFHATRPSETGLEMHLINTHKANTRSSKHKRNTE